MILLDSPHLVMPPTTGPPLAAPTQANTGVPNDLVPNFADAWADGETTAVIADGLELDQIGSEAIEQDKKQPDQDSSHPEVAVHEELLPQQPAVATLKIGLSEAPIKKGTGKTYTDRLPLLNTVSFQPDTHGQKAQNLVQIPTQPIATIDVKPADTFVRQAPVALEQMDRPTKAGSVPRTSADVTNVTAESKTPVVTIQPTSAPAPLTFVQMQLQSFKEQTSNAPLLAEQEAAPLAASQSTTTPLAPAPIATPMRSHAPQVATQIATALVQSANGSTEIALNPEELGRVRIVLTHGEAGLSVAILAERPETADLMRRNLDVLAREFSELGHENISFTFGDQSDDTNNRDENHGATGHTLDDAMSAPDPGQSRMTVALSGGLDLKL